MSTTYADALAEAERRFSPSPTARSDAEELLGRLVNLSRTDLYLYRYRTMDPELGTRFDGWVRRRAAGEPVQYVTGRAAFRGVDLAVGPAVLIPRPETEGLVERVIEVLRSETARWPRPRVLDLGTGSGAIAIAIASEWPAAIVTATDSSEEALEVACVNAASLRLEDRMVFRPGDWFEPIDADDRFEVIVSNPPYIATGEWAVLSDEVRRFEPHVALFSGASGLDALREIVDESPRHLVAGGVLALELAEMRAHEVAGWLDGGHEWEDVRVVDDLAGLPRVLLARRQRGPAIAPVQWPEER